MFERFTERARQVVVMAQDEARRFKHGYIGTEHVLLGLLREEEGVGAKVLDANGITLEMVREDVRSLVGEGERKVDGQIPFTTRAKTALEFALREALSLGHNYIGTEHILLGLIRPADGVAKQILDLHDLDAERLRNDTLRLLSGTRAEAEPDPPRQSAGEPSSVRVLEAGFFTRYDETFETEITPGVERLVWGYVVIEKSGATEEGAVWTQQARVEGLMHWPLYDWQVVSWRDGIAGEWHLPAEPERPLSYAEIRDKVALALHRAHPAVRDANTGQL